MKHAVIIGGGFAGSLLARKLESFFKVTLIDTKDYFEFTPGILRTIVEPSHIRKIQVMHSHYLRKARVIRGEVKEVTEKEVFFLKRVYPSITLLFVLARSMTLLSRKNLLSFKEGRIRCATTMIGYAMLKK